ncbi:MULTISPECIES: epoxide hydrolase family protein [unclassified Bradyrhizobium]|uniref:epoxide hydrolase family protein n=1 Tax=unclassified Bradyrhizobium TaxID=2631580 RepID=UPI001BA4A46E|nr:MULTISPECIES: epoxide hydrolase family protein [unclassified Bradyrhizobium]MBR1203827.1 epoxide hydrolase [Bradyrhizobium sp. AUGA SZCCT0124]MBR1310286.1 epoxide hydrolase [Bradyrhizobium sp. AUGA SZCCT0051]MBR1340428.1 epoxide hydrolase [Bradyrhizobium sp. AUGA SZCCT0105]MBR1355035.1 epoxide hydrolase [Bradyrhizobium sp. AUGA SZCCT0045]
MNTAISPFRIAVSDDVLEDLRIRLRRTRWPEAELVDDWSQGAPLQWIKDVCHYWAEAYDWRQREAQLNRFSQFTTEIDGLDIHFVHVRSKHPEARPLIITHGWPGSVVEFHKVIEPLTDPTAHGGSAADAFHVVCPSLPGFGFSAKPGATGWGVDRIAKAWAVLMERLGYARYFAQGGDWGSAVTTAIGGQDAAHCAGIHITLAMSTRPNVEGQPTPEETRALNGIKYYADWDSGYSKQQSTRPQTLGYALTDSPSGQAAWILEKFWAWTDCDGHPENILSRDELLDNVMLYWVTETAASSARLYWESFGPGKRTPHKVSVPTGVAVFPKEIVTPVRKWMETNFTNIQHWREMPKGGHFSAFEQPDLFVGEVREFFGKLR